MSYAVSPETRAEIEEALVLEDPFEGLCSIGNHQRCHRPPRVTVDCICLACGMKRTRAPVCLRHWWQLRRHKIGHAQPGTSPACPPGGPWHLR